MVDTSGQQDLRGIDVDKLAKGFADEETIFKKFVQNSTTSAREIRWFQKTSGFLTATSPAVIHNVSEGAQPFILEQSWTRNTSYVRKYFVESPVLSDEDVRDSDIDLLAGNVRDLTRAIEYKVDGRIYDVLTDSLNPTSVGVITASGAWNGDGTTANPILDIMKAKLQLRMSAYNPEGAVLIMNASGSKNLLSWLINVKGSSIPAFSSQKVESGVVMEILGCRVVVSENTSNNYVVLAQAQRACTWKQFVPITARTIEEIGIGVKIRVWEEGEAILTDPKAVCLISGSGTV